MSAQIECIRAFSLFNFICYFFYNGMTKSQPNKSPSAKPNPKRYQNFTVKDFNNYDCLKLSWGIWALLIYLLRGYLAVIMSVTNMSDKLAIISFFYPQAEQLYLTLIAGLPAVFLFVVIMLRKPDAGQWVKTCWRNYGKLATIALALALAFEVFQWFVLSKLSLQALLVHSAITLGFFVYLRVNSRLEINLSEFPEKIEAEQATNTKNKDVTMADKEG